jgi:hypothetical protein
MEHNYYQRFIEKDYHQRCLHLRALCEIIPEINSLLETYVSERLSRHRSIGTPGAEEYSIDVLKKYAAQGFCKRIARAEAEVGAHYTDDQLINKIKADIIHSTESLREYGAPPVRKH